MAKEYIPLDIVKKLAEEGKSEAETVDELKKHGFTDSQIDKALKAAIKESIEFAEEEPEEIDEAEEIEREQGSPRRPVVTGEAKEANIGRRPSEEIAGRISEESEEPLEEEPEEIAPDEETEMPPEEEPEEIEAPAEEPEKEEPVEEDFEESSIGQIGVPPETIGIPERLKPIEIGARPASSLKPAAESADSSEITLEEIVEAVVHEKTVIFEEKAADLEKKISENQKQIDELTSVIGSVASAEKKTDTELNKEIHNLSDSIDEIMTRVSALEKAFKELSGHVRK